MAPYRILVVDDSELVHELARMALSDAEAGWEVRCVASGAEALAATVTTAPDAVLLDVEMPDMDGPATVAALRAQPTTAQTPILFLTGHEDPAERARLTALEVAGVLSKPFAVTELADQVAGALGWTR